MSEVQLLVWLFGIHLVGFILVTVLLLPVLRERKAGQPELDSEEGGNDDGWGNLPISPRVPNGMPGGGLPLPDAIQSPVRLREHGRLSDRLRQPERRPVRDPQRQPGRQPVPTR
jgi:hypothetical protein